MRGKYSPPVTLICAICEQPFSVPERRAATAKYCSMACYGAGKRGSIITPRVTRTCKACGVTFTLKESALRKNIANVGSYCSKKCKGSIERREYVKRRNSVLNHAWRNFVLERDGFTCQQCGSSDRLNAHHIKPFATFPAGRFDPANGVTLCAECHRHIHRRPLSVAA